MTRREAEPQHDSVCGAEDHSSLAEIPPEPIELERFESSPSEGEVVYLWMSRPEICELLSIPPSQLMPMVERGDIACDLSGEKPRYRLLRRVSGEESIKWPELDMTSPAMRLNPPPSRAGVQPDYLGALVGLVDELTQQLGESERRLAHAVETRDEALDVANELGGNSTELMEQLNAYCQSLASTSCALQEALEIRTTLRRQLETMYVELRALADSPLALPIRSRLRALAEGAKPIPPN